MKRPLLITTIILIIAVCCIGLLIVSNSSAGLGLATNLCVGWTTTPRFQVGLAWVSPISSYMPSLMMSRYKLCVDLPSGLAPRRINGELMLPP